MKSRKPLVSIITPCYNSGGFLEECIQSVLIQDYGRIEHIIQDGGSTDNTLKILKKYSGKKYQRRIKWKSEPDRGQADGLNKALQKSTGDILLVLNADDALMPYACSWGVEQLNKYPECAVVYGDEYFFDENSNIFAIYTGKHPYSYERLFCVELVPPAQAAFIRRSMFANVGLSADVTLKTCPDFEQWVRIGMKYQMKHEFGVVAKYRHHSGSEGRRLDMPQKMVEAKLTVINRTLASPKTPEKIKQLRARAYAGLYHWGANVAGSVGATRLELVYLLKSLYYRPKLHKIIRLVYMPLNFSIYKIRDLYHRLRFLLYYKYLPPKLQEVFTRTKKKLSRLKIKS